MTSTPDARVGARALKVGYVFNKFDAFQNFNSLKVENGGKRVSAGGVLQHVDTVRSLHINSSEAPSPFSSAPAGVVL